MLYRHHTILRSSAGIGFRSVGLRCAIVVALALVVPILAHGYVVVMHGGHRIEIPDRFQLTDTALTYEASPGILVTLQLASIDIAETNMANGMPSGTFLRRTDEKQKFSTPSVAQSARTRPTRTLTNLDLEQTRLARIKSEAAYEIRRKELGLPSREETERHRQEESARAREMLSRSEVEKAEAENYWRARATSLRNEISVLDSEIEYVRSRLAETSDAIYVSYGVIGPSVTITSPVHYTGGRPVVGMGGQAGVRYSGQRPQIITNSQNQDNRIRRRFNAPAYFVPFAYRYDSLDRFALLNRLDDLIFARVGFQERWRILEDEARRAGAQPGWLRP